MLELFAGCSQRFAFADECKRAFCESAGLDFDKMLHDRDYKEKHRTELTRYFDAQTDADFFAEILRSKIAESLTSIAIVTDWRTPEEHNVFVQHFDCVIPIRIECSDAVRERRGWKRDDAIDTHRTETALDDFDFFATLNNDGSWEELAKAVCVALRDVVERAHKRQR